MTSKATDRRVSWPNPPSPSSACHGQARDSATWRRASCDGRATGSTRSTRRRMWSTASAVIARSPIYPEPVGGVLVVVPPEQGMDVVHQAAAAGISAGLAAAGRGVAAVHTRCVPSSALRLVAGECILMFARPTGVHKAHRWVWRMIGKIPA